MYISKISIRNFRSFQRSEVVFPEIKKPFSIVGNNNSGKSNLVQAILYSLAFNNLKNNINKNDFYFQKTEEEINIDLDFTPSIQFASAINKFEEWNKCIIKAKFKEDGELDYKQPCCKKDGNPIFTVETIAKESKNVSHSDEQKEAVQNKRKDGAKYVYNNRHKIPIYFIDSSKIHDQLKLNQWTLLGSVVNELKKDFEKKDNLMKKTSKDPKFVEEHDGKIRNDVFIKALKYLEAHVLSTQKFEETLNQIKTTIEKQLNIKNDQVDIKFGFPNYEAFFDSMEFYLSDAEDKGKPQLPIKNFGNGFISLFIIAIFQVLSQAKEGGNIYIIEEPETFLHEHYQEYFYKVLCELAEKNQVIYTTHSKKFVDIFDTQTIIKVSNKDFIKSEITQNNDPTFENSVEIDNSENPDNNFKLEFPKEYGKYISTIDPNINNLIFANKVIIVEGTHDKLIYKTLLDRDEVINGGFGLNNIAIVTGQGKSSIIVLIKICKFFNIKHFVIHDWDLPLTDDFENLDLSSTEIFNRLYDSEPADSPFKAQMTNNLKIFSELEDKTLIHQNKPKIEGSLNFERKDLIDNRNLEYKGKNSHNAYKKILKENGTIKTILEIKTEFPDLIPQSLLEFLQK